MKLIRCIQFAVPTLALTFVACASPQEKAADANSARHDADDKIEAINQDTLAQEAEVQRKSAEDSDAIARDGAKKMLAADGTANKKATDAVEALLKARADMRAASSKKRDDLDKAVIDLRTKIENKFSTNDAAEAQRLLRTKSNAVRDSILAINTTSIDTLDPVQKTIDARVAEFQSAVDDVKKRVD
jgi:hypothetical protein